MLDLEERTTGQVDVLVVEDDPDTRMMLRALLEAEGYACQEAACGREALDLARRRPPRLVLLDLMMPELDGLETARALRADPRTRGARIQVVSARTDPSAHRGAARAGCDGYLVKPINPSDLLDSVAALYPEPFTVQPPAEPRPRRASTSDIERRRTARRPRDQGIVARVAAHPGAPLRVGEVRDLSRDGIGLILDHRIDAWPEVLLELENPVRGFWLRRPIQVVHCTEEANGYFLLGGAFAHSLTQAEWEGLRGPEGPTPLPVSVDTKAKGINRRAGKPSQGFGAPVVLTFPKSAALTIRGNVIDRASGGLGLWTPDRLVPGTVFDVRLADDPDQSALVRVVYCFPKGKHWRAGFVFVDTPVGDYFRPDPA